MYPILMRLADRGQVETAWEQDLPRGRPPRHLYRLSPAGAELVAELRADAAARVAVAGRGRRGHERRAGHRRAERLLALATAGLPPRRAEWGAAMRAELAALDDPDASGASRAARRRLRSPRVSASASPSRSAPGWSSPRVTLTASRMQLQAGGPGVLAVTVPVPALLLLAVALVPPARRDRSASAWRPEPSRWRPASSPCPRSSRSKGWCGWTATACSCSTATRRGTPSAAPTSLLDLFTTGMWLGHLIFWLPWPVIGAALGAGSAPAAAGALAPPRDARGESVSCHDGRHARDPEPRPQISRCPTRTASDVSLADLKGRRSSCTSIPRPTRRAARRRRAASATTCRTTPRPACASSASRRTRSSA